MARKIKISGARVHNLKNIDVEIPRHALSVITGLSGSGKSSLAFDTIYAEGQRRYIETFSAYARHYVGNMERPDVDEITGLSPVIAIEQKTTNKNPRSTVGTVTEIYDFLRLLFARAADAYSYQSGEKMIKYSDEQILNLVLDEYIGKQCFILAPIVKNRKGHYKELFESLRKKGYLNVRVDGEMREILPAMRLDRYKNHDIEIVVDKLAISDKNEERIKNSIDKAMKEGDGTMLIAVKPSAFDLLKDKSGDTRVRYFSRNLMDPISGIAYGEPAPHNFSFNTPKGACPVCKGIGAVPVIDLDKIIPDKKLTIAKGGIAPIGKEKKSLLFSQIIALCKRYNTDIYTPIKDMPEEAIFDILNGSNEPLGTVEDDEVMSYFTAFDGVLNYLSNDQEGNEAWQKWAEKYYSSQLCEECNGTRLNKEALAFRVADKNIAELASMQLDDLYSWLDGIEEKISERQRNIAVEILKEIKTRISFLLDVGLGYLSLSRSSATLSGGESQRIRLATQIGSQLVNVLYILDEPSIGLHQHDNSRLIQSLKQLRDIGNTVIVVEHDEDMMMQADHIIDMGPKAGRLGGDVVYNGTPQAMLKENTLTAKYLNGKIYIPMPEERRRGNGSHLILKGAKGNNLKNVTLDIPLGMLVCISGVSGSGKSSLINGTLHPILSKYFYNSNAVPLKYDDIEGIDNIDKVVEVNQQPIGKTPRSNPATYTGIFNDIRMLFASLPEAQIRGYKPGRFSFNTRGGRCEECSGNGLKTIEMNFLPNVHVPCPVCHGKRYNRETLEVRFKGKSIADVLDMTINQAVDFFENMPTFFHKLKMLQDVGLGYVKLGQSSTTLSGGESQRIKIAAELAKKDTGKTLYILDEPTTGLHFHDINILVSVLQKLIGRGNTVVVIEHNLDVLRIADHIIDIGPSAGKNGGTIVVEGTPEVVAENKISATAPYLKKALYKQ